MPSESAPRRLSFTTTDSRPRHSTASFPRLIVSAATTVRDCEGMIATPGAIDVHVHFDSAGMCEHAIASGITTMLGGSLGPITVGQIPPLY